MYRPSMLMLIQRIFGFTSYPHLNKHTLELRIRFSGITFQSVNLLVKTAFNFSHVFEVLRFYFFYYYIFFLHSYLMNVMKVH